MDVSPERDSFLNLFYDEHMDTLLSPFLQPDMWTEEGQLAKDVQNDTEEEEAAKAKIAAAVALNGTARGMPSQAHRDALTEMACVAARRRERKACWDCARKHVVELLSFSVEHHGHRIKYYMLRNNVMQAVTALLAAVDKHLVLTALKFLRQVPLTPPPFQSSLVCALSCRGGSRLPCRAVPCRAVPCLALPCLIFSRTNQPVSFFKYNGVRGGGYQG